MEALFAQSYAKAGKLIGRANLDWISNPEAAEVDERYMIEGASSALQMIEDCQPELVLPMEMRSFTVLKQVLENKGYDVTSCAVDQFRVRISEDLEGKCHSLCSAFYATSPWGTHDFIVMKLPQHPARIFQADYATRCGAAIREASRQMAMGKPISIEKV